MTVDMLMNNSISMLDNAILEKIVKLMYAETKKRVMNELERKDIILAYMSLKQINNYISPEQRKWIVQFITRHSYMLNIPSGFVNLKKINESCEDIKWYLYYNFKK